MASLIGSIWLVAMTWLMARLFRVQTLLSGESLSVRRVWSALKD